MKNIDDYVIASISDVENDYFTGELIRRVRKEISKRPVSLRVATTAAMIPISSQAVVSDLMKGVQSYVSYQIESIDGVVNDDDVSAIIADARVKF